jgi:hypothetical protein
MKWMSSLTSWEVRTWLGEERKNHRTDTKQCRLRTGG